MVMAIQKILTAAEIAVRAAQAVQALRKTGNNEAALVLEAECNRACKAIVQVARRRRAAAARARAQTRQGGQFSPPGRATR